MAAEQSSVTTVRKIYYPIAYGMLSTREKQPLEGAEEISLEDLKAKTLAVENIDLRNKYVKKDGEYSYQNFYSTITGNIMSIEKDKYDKGTNLKVTIQDKDGDQSILQTPFYGKVSTDLLNRLASFESFNSTIVFAPYSIPSEFEVEGKKVKFYQSGVSLKVDGTKIARGFKKDDGLPGSERVQDAQGNDVTSRVKQVNWLWEKVEKITIPSGEQEAPKVKQETPVTNSVSDDNDLPF